MDDMWLVALVSIALLARVGLAVYNCGLARSKNAAGTLARHLTDFCVATLALWAVGMAVLWQHRNGYLGLDPSLLFGNGPAGRPATFFHLLLVLFATGTVVGTLGERSRFAVTTTLSVVLAAFLIPVLGHWAWFGFLGQHGFTDLAGAGVAHFAGGIAAAVAAIMVGPRTGKYNRDGSSNAIPGHSVPLTAAGALLTLVGWVPYLIAASIVQDLPPVGVAMRTMVAAAAGGLMSLWYARLRYGKVDLLLVTSGLLGGLVAISAGAHVIPPAFALLTGAVAGLLVPFTAIQLDLRLKLDDPTSGVAIHAVAGAWGILATALFAPPASAIPRALGIQLLGLLLIGVTAAVITAAALAALRAVAPLRSREADEYDGLDLAEHDINAYPDFQQTMIKSYHLREA